MLTYTILTNHQVFRYIYVFAECRLFCCLFRLLSLLMSFIQYFSIISKEGRNLKAIKGK